MVASRKEGQEAVSALFPRIQFLFVEYCTGFGKGRAATNAINNFVRANLRNSEKLKGLIVVHNELARDITWPKELSDSYPDIAEWSDYQIVCYASLRNMPATKWDWIISDECHYITPNNVEYYLKCNITSHILLTGVEPDDPEKIKILKNLSNRYKLKITLDEAVDNNLLNDYIVHIWRVTLTFDEKNKYLELCRKVDYAISQGNQFLIRNATGARMRFIYNLESKYKASCYIRDQIRKAKRRMVIFTGSKEIADRLSPYRYYEGTGTEHYNAFRNMTIDELACIKMIQEGANIDALDTALMSQINSKQLNFMQKLGRLMRLKIGEVARVHVIVAHETYDLTWALKATKALNQKKVFWHDLDAKLFKDYS